MGRRITPFKQTTFPLDDYVRRFLARVLHVKASTERRRQPINAMKWSRPELPNRVITHEHVRPSMFMSLCPRRRISPNAVAQDETDASGEAIVSIKGRLVLFLAELFPQSSIASLEFSLLAWTVSEMQFILFCLAAASIILSYILLRLGTYLFDAKRLRKHPSVLPFAGLTNLVYIGFNERARAKGGTRTEALLAAHQDRPILKLGPNRLSFAKPEAIKDIYGTGTKCIKGDQYTTIGGTPNLLSVVDKQFHSVKRKRLSRAFATVHLMEWEHKVSYNVRKLHAQLDAHVADEKTLDFRHWSNLFTMDAIISIALSLDTGFMQAGSSRAEITLPGGQIKTIEALDCLRSVNRAIEPFVWSKTAYTILKAFSSLTSSSRRVAWAKAADWQVYVGNLVTRRMCREREGKADDDLFACLLKDSKDQELNLSHAELAAETGHLGMYLGDPIASRSLADKPLVDAGSDTTSIALTHVMYCLAKNPDKLLILRKELDETLSHLATTEIPSYSQVRDLPYLRACLDEAMRLRPSLSPGLQRETPPEGLAVSGEWIPGNTMVSVSPFIAHRDPNVFPDPESFLPERWLDGKSKDFAKYILTFSAGGRVCIGKNIAYLEQTLLVASIVRRYDFSLVSKDWSMEWEEYFNTWPTSLPLSFRLRQA